MNLLHPPASKTNWEKQEIPYQAAFNFNLLSPEMQETKSIFFQKEIGTLALVVLYFDFIFYVLYFIIYYFLIKL